MAWLTWFVKHIDVGTASFAVAAFSLAVAVLSVALTRRGTNAAVRSAKAAEDQASGVRQQVDAAYAAMSEARQAYESSNLMLLESSRNRVQGQAPKPVVAIDVMLPPIMIRDSDSDPGMEKSRIPDELDFWANRWDEIRFVIRGVLINDGADAFKVIPLGPDFISGATPLSLKRVAKPVRIHPNYRMYLLNGGESALFEWQAGCSVDDWVDLSNRAEGGASVQAEFLCFAGSDDQLQTSVAIEIGFDVLRPVSGKKDKWRVVRSTPVIYVVTSRRYAKDVNVLRQDLTGEFWDGKNFWPKG